MQNLFIEENETFDVKFKVATDENGIIVCGSDEKSLKAKCDKNKKYEIKDYKITFARPSFGDSIELYDSIFSASGTVISFNPLEARYKKIFSLIRSWDLTEDKEITEEMIKKLHPSVANIIGEQVDLETGDMLG